MSSSFFLKKAPKEAKKRKFKKEASASGGKGKVRDATGPPKKKQPFREDEEIASDDDELDTGAGDLVFSTDEEEETPQDKRLRLAKQYLAEIEKQEAERVHDDQIHDHVGQRLQAEYLDSVGKLRRSIAASIVGYDADNVITLKHKKHHLPVGTIALSPDGQFLFSGGKSQYILKWNLKTRKLEGFFDVQPHREEPDNGKKRRSQVLAIAISNDAKFLALSEGGKNVQIWCPQELKHLKTLSGHRDVVTSLVFPRDSHELYSASRDRSVKIWSLDEMAYVESLFGHQAGVTDIDAIHRERAITAGGVDCSVRIWKITEESQLIYNGHRGSIEGVKYLNDELFISSGDDGSLCIWSALKKKPLYTETLVHGEQSNGDANWITALACVINTDLLASGSCDGYIRLWQVTNSGRGMKQVLSIPVLGFVNSLAFNSDGTKLYAAIGQEHRLGRWWRIKEAKNNVIVIDLLRTSSKSSR